MPSTPDLIELVSGRSPAVAYDLVEPLARFLTVAREVCGGDLEKVLLMVTISLRSSGHPDFKRFHPGELGDHDLLPGFGTNMRSLAESIGMPRETVRRKVQQLIDDGWVTRQGVTLYYTLEGYRAVEPARAAVIKMHVRGFQVIHALLDDDATDAR